MKKTSSNPKTYKVHSLERGLDLIEVLADGRPEKSLTELSQSARFNLSTTHRILNALKLRGYVEQNPDNLKYKLTFKFFEIGNIVVRHLNLREEATPILTELTKKTGESAYLIILDKDEALCLERIDGHHYLQALYLKVGGRMPLHIGAGSRVLLAYLPENELDRIIKTKGLSAWTKRSITNPGVLKNDLKKIREQGYALSFEEVTEDVVALGSPVRNWKGEVAAAISVCRTGRTNFCLDRKIFGSGCDGAFQEFVIVPARVVHPIPDSVSFEEAALAEPAACAYASVINSGIKFADRVLIIGPGPIGLMALQFAKLYHPTCLILAGTREERLSLGKKLGATHTINVKQKRANDVLEKIIRDKTANIVIQWAGTKSALELALEVSSSDSTIAFAGITGSSESIGIPIDDFVYRGRRIQGIHAFSQKEYTESLKMINKGLIRLQPLVTHTF